MSEQLALVPDYLTAHLQLTLVALAVGLTISVPLGVYVRGRPRLEGAVLGVASTIQTIPSLALLAIMVPALAWLGSLTGSAFGFELRSIGYLPAVIGLTLYSVLPMLRNTVTGLAEVDPAVTEAARAVGMTDRQRLLRVELPLAMPVLIAGVRTATVWTVGMATLSTPVGATSLGNFIFSGLQTRNFTAVLVGCVAAAGLALFLDTAVRMLEDGMRRRERLRIALPLTALSALALFAGGTWVVSHARSDEVVTIGAKTFTEQYILSHVMAETITRETGLGTRTLQSLGSTVAFDALREGEIDVYVDYSGTIWATIMKREGLPDDRSSLLDEVRAYLTEEHGIALVAAFGFENTYALAMRADRARSLGVERISELPTLAPRLEIGGDYEFFQRAEWAAIRDTYGLAFRTERSMDAALMYQAVRAGEVDVISAYSTDGRIAAFELRLLSDDRGVIPPYDAIILAGPHLAAERPEVLAALARLEGRIDETRMQQLNLAVDEGGQNPRTVALEFLGELREAGADPAAGGR